MIKCLVDGLPYININMNAGEDYNIPLSFFGDDGAPLDITGAHIFFNVKKYSTDVTNLIAKDISSFATPLTGKATVPITHADAKDLSGSYYAACEIKLPAGPTYIVVSKGKFNVEGVTTSQQT